MHKMLQLQCKLECLCFFERQCLNPWPQWWYVAAGSKCFVIILPFKMSATIFSAKENLHGSSLVSNTSVTQSNRTFAIPGNFFLGKHQAHGSTHMTFIVITSKQWVIRWFRSIKWSSLCETLANQFKSHMLSRTPIRPFTLGCSTNSAWAWKIFLIRGQWPILGPRQVPHHAA